MQTRTLGRTGRTVSVIGLGTWQLGADWGDVTEADALAVLEASVDAGVTFFDTADVYGDGRSEQLIGTFLAAHPGSGHHGRDQDGQARGAGSVELHAREIPRMDRPVAPQPRASTPSTWCSCTARRRRSTRRMPCYDALDTLVADGAIAAYGVSVETCDEALAAIARPGTATVQIILNAFRLKPLDEVLPAATRCRGRHHRARAARVGAARAENTRRRRRSRPTTTAHTTGTARRSTWARPSPVSTSRRAWRPRRSSRPSCRPD